MKKLLLAASIAAIFSLGAFAADGGKKINDDSKGISYYVLNQFNADFGDAEHVTWSITPSTQKAEFTVDGVKKTAFYNLNGTYLGLTEQASYKKVPAAAKKEIADDYAGYAVSQVIKFQASDADGAATYQGMSIGSLDQVNYFIDLKKADSEILVRVNERGTVYFFKQIK